MYYERHHRRRRLLGDSGTGKISAYLAARHQATYSARAGTGTNAGHSIFFADGKEIRTHQLPCSFLCPTTLIRVGSGVAVDPDKFAAELDALDPVYNLRQRTHVDFRCPIILPEYIEREKNSDHLRYTVGSVASGTGVARAEFALRQAQQIPQLAAYTTDVAGELNEACLRGETILIEGSPRALTSRSP